MDLMGHFLITDLGGRFLLFSHTLHGAVLRGAVLSSEHITWRKHSVSLVGVRFSHQDHHWYSNMTLFVMGDTRSRKCMVCGLSDGHTLIDCPHRYEFCGKAVNSCDCFNNTIVSGVLASETPEKKRSAGSAKASSSKGKAGTDNG